MALFCAGGVLDASYGLGPSRAAFALRCFHILGRGHLFAQAAVVGHHATAGQFDLLHFAGHGLARQADIANAEIVLGLRKDNGKWKPISLTSTTVEQFCDIREEPQAGGNRPIVFLNACQAGRAGYQLTGIGGFSQAFLRGGAGVFISSLWAVGDEPARTFTEQFYAELKGGKTVAEATRTARHKARASGDATWLAYVVYGDPHARIA